MEKLAVQVGGVITISSGVLGLLGALLGASQISALFFSQPFSIFAASQFIIFGSLAVGLIGIGVALLGLPDV